MPSESDVYDDFDRIRREQRIKSWRAKWVKRKHAFGRTEVPRGKSSWMKVVYGFNGELPISRFSSNHSLLFRNAGAHETPQSEHFEDIWNLYKRV